MATVEAEISVNRRVAGASLAAFGGICLAVQGRVNGQLGYLIHDGIFAALISTGIGLVLLVTAVATRPAPPPKLDEAAKAERMANAAALAPQYRTDII